MPAMSQPSPVFTLQSLDYVLSNLHEIIILTFAYNINKKLRILQRITNSQRITPKYLHIDTLNIALALPYRPVNISYLRKFDS